MSEMFLYCFCHGNYPFNISGCISMMEELETNSRQQWIF